MTAKLPHFLSEAGRARSVLIFVFGSASGRTAKNSIPLKPNLKELSQPWIRVNNRASKEFFTTFVLIFMASRISAYAMSVSFHVDVLFGCAVDGTFEDSANRSVLCSGGDLVIKINTTNVISVACFFIVDFLLLFFAFLSISRQHNIAT